jgi:hypothetical protein
MSKLCREVTEGYEAELLALHEVLESRYGLVLAQQIVDEIKKAGDSAYVPDYTSAKFLSEAVEFIRPMALDALASLKQAKLETSHLPGGVESLNTKRAEQGLTRLLGAYRLVKSTYWDFYTRIMTDIQKRRHMPVPRHVYVDAPRSPETAIIRQAA